MDPRSFWQAIYERFDPAQPIEQGSAWRVARPDSPADDILRRLGRPYGEKRYLIYGTVGAGKSSELRWIAEERARDDLVVLVDLHQHFSGVVRDPSALQHIQPWEVILLVGLSVYAAGEQTLGHRWTRDEQRRLAQAARRFLPPGSPDAPADVDVAKLAGTVAAMAAVPAAAAGGGLAVATAGLLTALGQVAGAARWNLPIGLRERSPTSDQDERAQELLGIVNHLIQTLQQGYRPMTLLVDGLDRITDTATCRELFIESSLLAELACPTVLCGPLSLRRSGFAGLVRGFEVRPLANVQVLDHRDPAREGTGIGFCIEVWRSRTRDLDPPGDQFPLPLLHRLAYFSGGRMRDLIQLVRNVAEQSWDRELPRADTGAVERAIDDRRRTIEEGLDRQHIDLLRSVMADPEHRLPAGPEVDRLLLLHWLLPYPNESLWWYPHPLLTRNILKRTG